MLALRLGVGVASGLGLSIGVDEGVSVISAVVLAAGVGEGEWVSAWGDRCSTRPRTMMPPKTMAATAVKATAASRPRNLRSAESVGLPLEPTCHEVNVADRVFVSARGRRLMTRTKLEEKYRLQKKGTLSHAHFPHGGKRDTSTEVRGTHHPTAWDTSAEGPMGHLSRTSTERKVPPAGFEPAT